MSNTTTTEDGLVHFWFGHFMNGIGQWVSESEGYNAQRNSGLIVTPWEQYKKHSV